MAPSHKQSCTTECGRASQNDMERVGMRAAYLVHAAARATIAPPCLRSLHLLYVISKVVSK
jgi:hypothetical protein